MKDALGVRIALGAMLFMGTFAAAEPAHAAELEVTTLADSGPGSLRQAIARANADPGADRVTFARDLRGEIVLSSPLELSSAVTVAGPGRSALTVRGAASVPSLFAVGDAVGAPDVTITGLGIEGGSNSITNTDESNGRLQLGRFELRQAGLNGTLAIDGATESVVVDGVTGESSRIRLGSDTGTATMTNLSLTGAAQILVDQSGGAVRLNAIEIDNNSAKPMELVVSGASSLTMKGLDFSGPGAGATLGGGEVRLADARFDYGINSRSGGLSITTQADQSVSVSDVAVIGSGKGVRFGVDSPVGDAAELTVVDLRLTAKDSAFAAIEIDRYRVVKLADITASGYASGLEVASERGKFALAGPNGSIGELHEHTLTIVQPVPTPGLPADDSRAEEGRPEESRANDQLARAGGDFEMLALIATAMTAAGAALLIRKRPHHGGVRSRARRGAWLGTVKDILIKSRSS